MRKRRSIIWGAVGALIAGAASGPAQSQETIEALSGLGQGVCRHRLGWYLHALVHTGDIGSQPDPTDGRPGRYPSADLPTPPGGTPPRENWYSPPAQIGDNLYWLGTRNHSTYALVNRRGGDHPHRRQLRLRDRGRNPQGPVYLGLRLDKVKYSIYGHAHGDHDGGAHLTEAAAPGATIVYGEGDWPSVLARTVPHATRHGPQNDGTDGRVITLPRHVVKIITYPGHTPGTISFLFEFMDGGKPVWRTPAAPCSRSRRLPRSTTSTSPRSEVRSGGSGYGAVALMTNHHEYDIAFYKANAAATLRSLREEPLGIF